MTASMTAQNGSQISVNVRETEAWRKLATASDEGKFPQALALKVPLALSMDFTLAIARELLCQKRGAEEPCPSCQSWSGTEHPDLLLSGQSDETPGIDRCRALWGELSLRPVVAPRRIAIFFNADKLSPGAANSMLKMTEEPPGNSVIVLLHDSGEILPTLRSRTWNLAVSIEEVIAPVRYPRSTKDWADWLSKTGRFSVDQMDLEVQGMVSSLLREQTMQLAEDLETVRLYARKGNLSVNMIQDIVFLLLKEEKPIGQLFADLW